MLAEPMVTRRLKGVVGEVGVEDLDVGEVPWETNN